MRVYQNPDKILSEKIKDKLKANDGYCPCRIQRTPENKCMCKEFRDMMERKETGFCHCHLYYIDNEGG